MSKTLTVTLHIKGYFPDDTITDWIIQRAATLDLVGWVDCKDSTLVEVVVTGESILIDALEVACSLGPINATVDTILRHKIPIPESFSRQSQCFVRYSELRTDCCST